MSPFRLGVLTASCALLSAAAACTSSSELGGSVDSPAPLETTSTGHSTSTSADDADPDASQPSEPAAAAPYRVEELRPGLEELIDTGDDVDQLMLGVFEGQLLSGEASVDRFVGRVQALEPAVAACLESDAGLEGDDAQLFAQGLLSETFGIEGPDGSVVVAFPDVVWAEIGPANPEAERAADASGCVDTTVGESGSVFVGPAGQRYFDLVRSGEWQTPDGLEDLFDQAIADHCGPDPLERCENETRVVVEMLPIYRETIRLNLDKLG